MAKLTAGKHKYREPYRGWVPHNGYRIRYYGVTIVEEVRTNNGPMTRATMRERADYADPATDIIASPGIVPVLLPNGEPNLMAPELFCWDHPVYGSTYWMQALDGGIVWYKKNRDGLKTYLMYRVEVEIPDGFMERLAQERDKL